MVSRTESAVTEPSPSTRLAGPLLVDAHVHLHDCFDTRRFLDAAAANFAAARRGLGLAATTPACLLFVDGPEERALERVHAAADRIVGWRISPRTERTALLASRDDGATTLVLIAGKQVRTRDGLEVLAIGTDQPFEPGLDLVDTVLAVDESGGVPIVPWGFGKWWRSRGARVSALLDSSLAERIYLGDNRGRPARASIPRLFRGASQRGVFVLPGTDPLPFARFQSAPGSFGFVLDGDVDRTAMTRTLIELLRALERQPLVYGRRESLPGFVRSQLAMQLRNRLGWWR